MVERLHIRLLGELELSRGATRLKLPPSKKTRALLGYLVLTGRAHRRERLCELLWDVADDPRAALRWSLSKLRELVDDESATRLVATREAVRFALADATVDVLEVRPFAEAQLADVSTAKLEAALACFRGELLEGLELPDFHAYYAFCLAEREALRGLHARIVTELLERAMSAPDRALPLARRLVDLDPTSERTRALFLQLLHASGREREAAHEAQKSRRLLEPARGPERAPEPSTRASPLASMRMSEPPPMLIGRRAELRRAREILRTRDGADEPPRARVLLVTGEAGIGKSALFAQLLTSERPHVADLHRGAAHELDPGFPYAALLGLLQQSGMATAQGDAPRGDEAAQARERLFHGVARALGTKLDESERPVLLAIEDLHWLDEASVLLLQHVVRACRDRRLSVLLTARSGELADNAAARRLVRALRSEGRLEELSLPPLSPEETCALVRGVAGDVDAAAVHAQSGGHPLFAIELARAPSLARAGLPASITRLVRERMESLAHEPSEVLRWASVLGTSFCIAALEPLLSIDPVPFVEALEQLERLGWLRFEPRVEGGTEASFSHDLVRRAVYDGLSEPRRRLMHGRIARRLAALAAPDESHAAEVARHAVLAGDAEMAVRACLSAGRGCVRLLATADVLTLARRGLAHVTSLPLPEACTLEIELHELMLLVQRPERPEELGARLSELATRALALRQLEHARRGFYLQSLLRWEQGKPSDARRFSREAERLSRLEGPRARLCGLADAARCLTMLNRDLADAQAFVLEAEALVAAGEAEIAGFRLAAGMLELHRGAHELAAVQLERAVELAQLEGEPLIEFVSLEYRLELALSDARLDEAEATALRLAALGTRMREGSEAPFACAALALVQVARGTGDTNALEEAVRALALADAKQRTAYVLTRWAELLLACGDHAQAAARAREALALAAQIEHPSETALARAVLASVAHAARDEDAFARENEGLAALGQGLSARARVAVERARAYGTSP